MIQPFSTTLGKTAGPCQPTWFSVLKDGSKRGREGGLKAPNESRAERRGRIMRLLHMEFVLVAVIYGL